VADRVAGAKAAKDLLGRDERLRKKVFVHAYSLTRNLEDAKDLAQTGIAKVIDPEDSPWDPDKQPNLLLHVGSVMNGLARNTNRGHARHPTVAYEPARDPRPDGAPTPEEQFAHAEDLARLQGWLDKLLVRLAGDSIALGKIDLMRDGIDDAAEQAKRLRCSVEDIYRANERIAYHASIVKRAARKDTDDPEARP
jgi:DNA-directed RNA polymerase specialized sigma24 family protein